MIDHAIPIDLQHDTVSEWLRRWTQNPLGSARRGSNPFGVDVIQSFAAHIVSVSHKTHKWKAAGSCELSAVLAWN